MGQPERIAAAVTGAVEAGQVPGAAWWVGRHGEVLSRGAAGAHTPGTADLVRPDSVFRLSSTTKPVVAAAAMALVDDGVLDLDAPVDPFLPELADRRVLVDPREAAAGTVPAARPITVRDVLTFRLGLGLDFTAPWPSPTLAALARAGLPSGPPSPQAAPPPDQWMRALGTVPLAHQPGERWLYHVGASVLGVLVARAAGRPLPEVLAARVLEPLGMRSTGFGVPPSARDRLGPHWTPPDADGTREVYDPADGQWARPPAFPDGGDGLVSTVDDLAAFARMLQTGGATVLSADAVRAMTTEQVGPVDDEGGGWGLGIGVRITDEPGGRHAGSYGWDGGLGSSSWTDPVSGVTAVLLTNQMWASPEPPPLFAAFRAAAFAGLEPAPPDWHAARMAGWWEDLVERTRGGDVSAGTMFGCAGLRTGRRFFAVRWEDRLVVKLPAERREGLERDGAAEPFEPMPGRPMNGWVVLAGTADADALVGEARAWVEAQPR